MKNKKIIFCSVTVFFLICQLLISIPNNANAATATLSDAELMALDHQSVQPWEFYKQWGPANEISRVDISGPGVQFTINSLSSSGSAWGDNYELNALAGGTGLHNANFTDYDQYAMYITNQSDFVVNAHLYMNTGFLSGEHPDLRNSTYDTFWAGQWEAINPGETKLLMLDFSNAQAYNIDDDPVYGGLTNGNWYSIFRLDEVTNIGFEIADFSDNTTGQQVALDIAQVPIPSALLLFSSGILGLLGFRKKISL